MDVNKNIYFLEMNTRLQVEHPVTEMITGIDLVKEQIKIASGERLSIKQEDLQINGHAVECRIYAEDVANNFAPSMGTITHHRLPSGYGIRVDRGIELLSEISVHYDPMLSKVVAWGKTRNESVSRIIRALSEYQIAGVTTNITALRWVLEHDKFIDGSFDINFVDNEFIPLLPDEWRIEGQEEYEEVASVLSAVLKAKETELKPINIDCNPSNKWSQLNYE
jgi:acetyl/propionyl-CoA carboxylase alpha subunit